MRYTDIKPNDAINGVGISVSLWVQGCPHHCKGCFNQETWDFNGGKEFGYDELNFIIKSLKKNEINRNFSILGGEPLCPENINFVRDLIKIVKFSSPNSKIFVWSGYTYEKLIEKYPKWWLEDIDVLIDGKFEIDKKDLTLKLRGSTNQRVIDVQESLRENTIVLFK